MSDNFEMRATTVPGETRGEMVRRGLLRLLRAEWTDWGELLDIGRATGWDADTVAWLRIALREAIANGEVERYGGYGVRLTEKGLRAQGIMSVLAIEVRDE